MKYVRPLRAQGKLPRVLDFSVATHHKLGVALGLALQSSLALRVGEPTDGGRESSTGNNGSHGICKSRDVFKARDSVEFARGTRGGVAVEEVKRERRKPSAAFCEVV
jgi:hypothetical protein